MRILNKERRKKKEIDDRLDVLLSILYIAFSGIAADLILFDC